MTLTKRLARARRAFFRDDSAPVQGRSAPARSGVEYFYLSPELALTRLLNGYLLYIDPQDETMSAHLIGHGYWEPNVYSVVWSLVRPGDTVVEVGANVGYYTVAMAALVGEAGSVTSFEANPRLAEMVEKSAYINGFKKHVRVVPKAVFETPGTIKFDASRKRSGWGHVSTDGRAAFEDSVVLDVEATNLDAHYTGPVDFIRLDAEGSEPFILRGGQRTIEASPGVVICMEWDPIQMAGRTSLPEFIEWLHALGFRSWRIGLDGSLTAVDADRMIDLETCDIVCSRTDPVARRHRVRG
ncbi:FkbM family methyltransferase [Brevundimonas sp.]|uniref:FkbM family methyltransferase n=1 Tax=Brevundimonas sp. TaxID=1871086 RepID=UPI001A19D3E0|nr:FkbM family methyltransferase [Brevundimonas sp.]MBJ7485254.1 FkbM family methyltransferase [Brevundimonas sp.]